MPTTRNPWDSFGGLSGTSGSTSIPGTSIPSAPAHWTPPTTFTASGGVSGNLAEITNLINNLNLTAQQTANRARIPNASALETQSSQNIDAQLRGQLSPDVMRTLEQQAAERGVASGIGGSPNDSAAYLRALGLTSLDLQDRGQQNLTAALARNPAAPLYDPSQLVLTPYQQGSLQNQLYENRLRSDQLALARWEAEQSAAQAAQRIANETQQVRNQSTQTNAQYGPKEYSYSHIPIGPDGRPMGQPEYAYRYWQ